MLLLAAALARPCGRFGCDLHPSAAAAAGAAVVAAGAAAVAAGSTVAAAAVDATVAVADGVTRLLWHAHFPSPVWMLLPLSTRKLAGRRARVVP